MMGFNDEISDQEYAAIDAVRSGDLGLLLKSPLHYKNRGPRVETDALKLGIAVDVMVLRPELADELLAVAPAVDKRTKEGKLEHARWLASVPMGTTILATDTYDRACRMADSLLSYAPAREMLEGGVAQRTLVAPSDVLVGDKPLMRKARPDYMNAAADLIIDLKTARDASPWGFTRAMIQYGYVRQAAWYMDVARDVGFAVRNFAWLCVENVEPYCPAGPYYLSPEDIDIGRAQCDRALRILANCIETDTWPGYTTRAKELRLPAWARDAGMHYEPEDGGDSCIEGSRSDTTR